MANVSAPAPIFSRGSAVLDYWLVHAEGLTVQPLGARVEEVVVAAPVGHAESLIVRSRRTRRRKAIPAAAIVAVEPSAGRLLMDARTDAGPRLRISPERIASVRSNAEQGRLLAQAHAGSAVHSLRNGSLVAFSWLRPRAVQTGKTTLRHTRFAAVQTGRGAAWLTPRAIAGARAAVALGARLTIAAAVMGARGVARTARELDRATTRAAARANAALDARRTRRRNESND